MLKFLKMLIGLALLPACWSISRAAYHLYQVPTDAEFVSGMEVWALPIGFFLQVTLFLLLPKPVRTYVLGHELTHALWALLMGARVGKLSVGKSGGHVEVSKSNFIITLAPYFFPFYTFLVIAAYYLASIWIDVTAYWLWWLGAIGFTWSFHLTFTIHMLSQQQPDIKEHGHIFSHAVIFIMNVLTIGAWIVVIGSPTFGRFGELIYGESLAAYTYVWSILITAWDHVTGLIKTIRV